MRPIILFAATLMLTGSCLAADTPHLVIDSPKDGAAVDGAAIIRFHAEGVRMDAEFGDAAAKRRPAAGHLHVVIDDLPVLLVYTSPDPLVLAAMKPGPHSVRMDLADPNHQVLDSQVLHFTVK